jgi:hypothetical protein
MKELGPRRADFLKISICWERVFVNHVEKNLIIKIEQLKELIRTLCLH